MALDCLKSMVCERKGGRKNSLRAAGWISGLRIGLKNDWMGVDLAEITKRRASMPFLRKNHQMF